MKAQHLTDGSGNHLVQIVDLQVWVFRDGEHWVAQGLDIDYAAAGETLDEVRMHFSKGLCATIEEHLKKFKTIDALIRPAPRDVWLAFTHKKSELQASIQSLPAARTPEAKSIRNLAFWQPAAST